MGRQSLSTRASRAAGAQQDITEKRINALGQMNDALREKTQQIEGKINDLQAENLRYYHRIGVLCDEIRQDPTTYVGMDGTPGLKLLEDVLSTQSRTLSMAARFANEYSEEQLEQLIALRNTDTNFQLHWGHVGYLLTLDSQESREATATRAVDGMWTPSELHENIRSDAGRTGGHGRSHTVPRTVMAQVRQILTQCRTWVGKYEAVWANDSENNVFTNVLVLPPDEMNDTLREYLDEIHELMGKMTDYTQSSVDLTERTLEHVNECLDTRQRREEVEQDHGRALRVVDLDANVEVD